MQTFMKNRITILATIGIVVVGIGIFAYANSSNSSASKIVGNDPESLKQELERITQYELENGCVETTDRGQEFCGESKAKVDAAHAAYQAAVKSVSTPDTTTQQADTAGIRTFMADSNLEVAFTHSRSPSNFTVAVVTPISSGGDSVANTPAEWKHTVNVYRTTSIIDGTCEVYEFEVYPKTHEVVQVHVVYPDGYAGQCTNGNMFSPVVSDEKIKEVGNAFATRIAPDKQFTISPLTRGTASRVEWKWEDASYKLPEGVSGGSAVDSRPTIRMHISSAGKILQYNNTIPLFE